MSASLPFLLRENLSKFSVNYEDFLNSSGGFPLINSKKRWVLAKSLPRGEDRELYFNNLAAKIIENAAEIMDLPNAVEFVKKFNIEWMKARRETTIIQTDESEEILFNSKSPNFSWLSNFFPTLIYSETPFPAIFMGVESAYKAYKAFLSGASEESLSEIIRSIDLKKAKRIRPLYLENQEMPFLRKEKVSLMRKLISDKFSQNSILEKRLEATGSSMLVEHTDHPFWGDGSSTSSVSKGEGDNRLGKILMRQREIYTIVPRSLTSEFEKMSIQTNEDLPEKLL